MNNLSVHTFSLYGFIQADIMEEAENVFPSPGLNFSEQIWRIFQVILQQFSFLFRTDWLSFWTRLIKKFLFRKLFTFHSSFGTFYQNLSLLFLQSFSFSSSYRVLIGNYPPLAFHFLFILAIAERKNKTFPFSEFSVASTRKRILLFIVLRDLYFHSTCARRPGQMNE